MFVKKILNHQLPAVNGENHLRPHEKQLQSEKGLSCNLQHNKMYTPWSTAKFKEHSQVCANFLKVLKETANNVNLAWWLFLIQSNSSL